MFLEVGKYLHHLLVNEITHGCNPHLKIWKDKGSAFVKAYQTQFRAFAQGTYPFSVPLGPNQTPLEWWEAFEDTTEGGVLAVHINFNVYCASG
jgi:hypothetical protein